MHDKSGGSANRWDPARGLSLDEKISEMIASTGRPPVAALAVIMIDNPMLAGTGHRICNDA